MSSRMDKYKNKSEPQNSDELPTRSDKNKELYKQIYNAYDNFENLIVPSNAREITVSDLKKEIASRQEYREQKETEDTFEDERKLTNRKVKQENDEIYDINELINKAVSEKQDNTEEKATISNGDYLKKLKLDNRKTNIEQVKELYEDIKEEALEEDEELLKTANLSLEILSDLKSDNTGTMVSAPIKNEEMPTDSELDFYSSRYKFSKKDFDDDDFKEKEEDDEEEDDDDDNEHGNGKFFFKILVLIFGLLLIAGVLLFFINYFNRV